MNTQTVTTRTDAIQHLIIEPIEHGDASAADFDIDAIADEVLGTHEQGYAQQVSDEEFWQVVQRYALPLRLTWGEMEDQPGDWADEHGAQHLSDWTHPDTVATLTLERWSPEDEDWAAVDSDALRIPHGSDTDLTSPEPWQLVEDRLLAAHGLTRDQVTITQL